MKLTKEEMFILQQLLKDDDIDIKKISKQINKFNNVSSGMSLIKIVLALIFPPLAVMDKGCGTFFIICVLTCCGWLPGVIGALLCCLDKK